MTSIQLHLSDERALVRRAIAEPDAFAPIFDHYFPRVYNYVRYRVQDAPTADDLTALTFERAFTRLGSYRPDGAPFGAWLFGIARHVVTDHFRMQRGWTSLDELAEEPAGESLLEEAATRHDERQSLLAALARLRDRERDLLALKFGADMGNAEIARLTGLTESNVGVIVYRAIQQLRKWMQPEVPHE